ncbi:hypothetical protein A3D81_00480 [Candidatus Curtissbacteria bacterium RIFCSPHIGHO2_02_FULL_40_17]|uniref:Uncharacterized protein n=3 Tax=Candidatus Curtissiibacteriota TaxID=1752717 RepID=A0A1F5GJB3_9BACT|nr:MAG: hypothetical protein A3D81_00480 [Candidatus Curtissbacteria bacterium RIFCSPHIGHO2_02_FULL_40_17]OGE05415.1 MAG: hypothetical protein A3F45_03180 [Candidatus Curtissbacteria bacterium RIFCSPHIGHO2_12_FULL_41_17]OGE07867.1 MAG: hypothetical protein A3I53_04240 [Candidatus Curtissbacteria bacterium RIFCSPLOWO2_02_FULL_40_13b]
MKEIAKAIDNAFVAVPEPVRDYLTVKAATVFLELGAGHSLEAGRCRFWGHEMLERWYRGESTPLSLYATRLFDRSKFDIGCAERFTSGPAIVVINEPSDGPVRGGWLRFVTSYAVAQARNRFGNFEPRWVQEDISANPLWQTPLGIARKRLSYMIHESCNTILISSDSTDRKKAGAVLEMRRHLNDNGVLVISPERRDGPNLSRARVDAGDLIYALCRKNNIPIYPAGGFWQPGRLSLRIGRAVHAQELLDSKLFRGQSNTGQRVGDLLMVEVAKLLPESKRGIYTKSVGN